MRGNRVVSLRSFGIDEYARGPETVTMLVGPNGSGKSSLLLKIAQQYRFDRNVTIICNTPHDRFVGLRYVKRISVGKSDHSPNLIVKRAVAGALNTGSEFYQISSILKHCGYRPRFGFRIDRSSRYGMSFDELVSAVRYEAPEEHWESFEVPEDDGDLQLAIAFLQRHKSDKPIWVDATGPVLEFSLAREFRSVLVHESRLRSLRVIKGISIYLCRDEDGREIEIRKASSGQLALISSLLFLITNVGESPLIIIDEPENSLHPNWQREYVEKVLSAMSYRGATLIIATHAPLVVTGALSDSPEVVSVYEVREGSPRRLDLNSSSAPSSIEEILWRAFDVVTPANHFVSEQIITAISLFEQRQIGKSELLDLIGRLDGESFDRKQKRFFDAVRQLVDKVELAREGSLDWASDRDLGGDDDD